MLGQDVGQYQDMLSTYVGKGKTDMIFNNIYIYIIVFSHGNTVGVLQDPEFWTKSQVPLVFPVNPPKKGNLVENLDIYVTC